MVLIAINNSHPKVIQSPDKASDDWDGWFVIINVIKCKSVINIIDFAYFEDVLVLLEERLVHSLIIVLQNSDGFHEVTELDHDRSQFVRDDVDWRKKWHRDHKLLSPETS